MSKENQRIFRLIVALKALPFEKRTNAEIDAIGNLAITCKWTYMEDACWDTDCGQQFYLEDGTPKENDMRFCNFCGGELEQVITDLEAEAME